VASHLEGLGVTFILRYTNILSYTNDFLANLSGGIKTGAVGFVPGSATDDRLTGRGRRARVCSRNSSPRFDPGLISQAKT